MCSSCQLHQFRLVNFGRGCVYSVRVPHVGYIGFGWLTSAEGVCVPHVSYIGFGWLTSAEGVCTVFVSLMSVTSALAG